MEFLNPEDKRSRTIRLFVGYTLVAVLIGLATYILVALAQGYGYDPTKGVSQNSLVFFSSQPSGADIYVDNQLKAKTDARLTLPEGAHNVSIKKDKYRDWNRTINLDGGTVLYLQYPRLFPVNIPLGITQAYAVPPTWVSQSPDRRWLLVQPLASSLSIQAYDLTKPNDSPQILTIPASQVGVESGSFGTFSAVEWSDDNQHLLVQQTLPSGKLVYIIIDRTDAAQAQNITAKLNLPAAVKVSLRDKKFDKYFVYTATGGTLQTADLKSGVQAAPLLSGVVGYKTYADNLILYTTYTNAKPDEAIVRVLSNQTDSYLLQSLPRDTSGHYLLDIAKYDNSWYYVTASASDKKVILYKDPLSKASPGNITPIAPRLSLLITSPQFTSFSDNARFISFQNGQQFVVYDAELGRVYRYKSTLPISASQQAKWMDGHRMTVVTDSKVHVFDFDGTNLQTLTASRPEFTAYFDRDYKYIYTLVPQTDGHIGFQNGQIVL